MTAKLKRDFSVMNNYSLINELLCTLAKIIICISFYGVVTNAQIKWEVNTENIILGHPFTLKCVVPENTCPENYVRRWFGGPEKKLLCINYNSSNRTKYEMSAVKLSSSFELIIYNFNESDIDCEYECSCGFDDYRKRLTVQQIQNKLKYPLDRWTMNTAISMENDLLNVQWTIYKVYPIPICRLLLNESVYTEHMNFTTTYRDNILFPSVNFSGQIPFNKHICIATVKIECFDHINKSFFLVVNDTVQDVGNCKDYSGPLPLHVIFVPLGSGLFVCFAILAYRMYSRKCQPTQFCETNNHGKENRNISTAKEENITTCKCGFHKDDLRIKQPFLESV